MVSLKYKGIFKETLPSGRVRYKVRMKGSPGKQITLTVPPGHPDFHKFYEAARSGIKLHPDTEPTAVPKSINWLSQAYEKHLQERFDAGQVDQITLRTKKLYLGRLRDAYGAKHMDMPPAAVIELRDKYLATPAAADNLVKAIRAMYAWAIERGHVKTNPAAGIRPIHKARGAVPWTVEDLRQFREAHPRGTMAHLALSIFMFTACRRGDAFRLGPGDVIKMHGIDMLDWRPAKKGSERVTIPILPPLRDAIDAQSVRGTSTYLLNAYGQPFASSAAFGNWFADRVKDAGLVDRSAHGIRKAAGHLLAEEGATQHQIMSVHGHAQAATSEVYTKSANRVQLAISAMDALKGMEW